MSKLLEVEKLSISFSQYFKGLEQRELKVLSDLTMDVDDHEILAVLGSSGSGKSLLAHAILGILPTNAKVSGSIRYKGKEMDDELKQELRGDKISFIPQSVNNLNPLMKVKDQAIGYIEDEDERKKMYEKQRKIFNQYDLSEEVDDMYPFQLSGGMARKVLISTALLNDPEIIIADEPTPGLDEKAVEETINNLIELKEQGIGMILITHDIHTAIETSDRIAILYLGYVIEITDTKNFTGDGEKLLHPYTRSLYRALPETDFELTEGHQPSYLHIPKGCPYHENCPHQVRECHYELPELREVNGTIIRCFNPLVDGD
ncbi:MAG: peptide ABC transporter ATP-binding protein [Methanosphaera sp. SHI613]|jgi:peptide/nickel transport system ATP-binding protein|nr:MAG: peptide ABC transporter ATP-binding protein [Methanosphaera sp. SHI613]